MSKLRKMIVASAAMTVVVCTIIGVRAACYAHKNPNAYNVTNPSLSQTQKHATLGQENSSEAANVWCLGGCLDTSTCTFAAGPDSGCTSDGTYTNVWIHTSNASAKANCDNGTTYYYSYTYGTSPAPTLQGTTVKYIIDMMGCGT